MAEALIAAYEHGVGFVDLAPLQDPNFVPSAVASALGLAIHSGDALPALIAYLRDRRTLVVLDSCEHVIDAAASLAEQIISGAPAAHILATSREPLRVKGEQVHHLSPLESPPNSSRLTAVEALSFPAVQLFVERATESLESFELNDTDAPVVADICRKLEGIALAIELAATRVGAFGVWQLSILLDDRFRLLQQGRRAALSRHRTLAAALDWSHELLPEDEGVILRRLSVFAGSFTAESASAVAADTSIAAADVVEGVANLAAKSLVSADVSSAVVRYRLLDTTRAYALQKLSDSSEFDIIIRRHAEHHRDLFERAEAEWEAQPTVQWLMDYGYKIDDVRSALNWAFGDGGDLSIGVALTAASLALWMHLSLLDECRRYVERALAALRQMPSADTRREMQLRSAHAASLMSTKGAGSEVEAAWEAALEIAESLDDAEFQLRALRGLCAHRLFVGEYRPALGLADRFRTLAAAGSDLGDRLVGERMLALAQHYLGDQSSARSHIERMLASYVTRKRAPNFIRFQRAQDAAALDLFARILWLQGFPDQAIRAVQDAVLIALETDHAASLCHTLANAACPLALYVGDSAAAQRYLAMLQEHVAKHALTIWNAPGQCLQGVLLIERGDAAGLPLLRSALGELRAVGFLVRYPAYLATLAQGLGAAGEIAEGHAAIDAALEWTDKHEGYWCTAELLRIKGELFRLEGSAEVAEEHYQQALEWARRQNALSWELRATASRAQLWHQNGSTEEAEKLLLSVYNRFSEGFETADLMTARALIDNFRTSRSGDRGPLRRSRRLPQ
jgi:predicted ATPase